MSDVPTVAWVKTYLLRRLRREQELEDLRECVHDFIDNEVAPEQRESAEALVSRLWARFEQDGEAVDA